MALGADPPCAYTSETLREAVLQQEQEIFLGYSKNLEMVKRMLLMVHYKVVNSNRRCWFSVVFECDLGEASWNSSITCR